jgi:hypothetical protein
MMVIGLLLVLAQELISIQPPHHIKILQEMIAHGIVTLLHVAQPMEVLAQEALPLFQQMSAVYVVLQQ